MARIPFLLLLSLPILLAQQEAEEHRKHLRWRVTHEMDEDECKMWSQEGDKIFWKYKGTLLNGFVFDQGKFEAVIGAGQVIKGVDLAMRDMCPGEKRRMRIEPEWAYGEQGYADLIPPNSVLVFEVQLLKIKRGSKTAEFKPTDEL